MSFVWKPAVYHSATGLFQLPRPVVSLAWQDAWDFEQFKVPLADGDALVGHSHNGVDIRVEGQVGQQAGALKLDEQDMFGAIETLRNRLDVNDESEKYEFFVYHDSASGTYRKFKSASTVRFECDLSDVHLFTYTVLIHAEDPTMYNAAPGA